MYLLGASEGQRVLDPQAMGCCETSCGCWELNTGLLQEQQMLLAAEASHQPHCPPFLEAEHLTELRAHRLARLAGQQAPRTHQSLVS